MNFNEAIQILELSKDFNEEQLKKQFKKLAAKYHPDVNKEPGSEEKSKKISEAYSFLKEYLANPQSNFGFVNGQQKYSWTSVNNINTNFDNFPDFDTIFDMFQNAGIYGHHNLGEDKISIDITLEEAISGCKKTITRLRTMLCTECTRSSDKPCSVCDNKKVIKKQENINLNIPATNTFNYIEFSRINGGNYNENTRKYNSLKINIKILPHDKFLIRNSCLLYKTPLKLNLLQILEGDKIKLETLNGDFELLISPKPSFIKNEIEFLNKNVCYKIPVVIEYPEDVTQLTNLLKDNYGFSTTVPQS